MKVPPPYVPLRRSHITDLACGVVGGLLVALVMWLASGCTFKPSPTRDDAGDPLPLPDADYPGYCNSRHDIITAEEQRILCEPRHREGLAP